MQDLHSDLNSCSRSYNRLKDQIRPIEIITNFTKYAEGSVLISFGDTKVLCNASIDNKVPHFIKVNKKNHGWVTAEYSMLPRSTHTRCERDGRKGVSSRSLEIQRLIARSLRSMVDLDILNDFTISVDCDVIQADGGTRVAAITGAAVALYIACDYLVKTKQIIRNPVKNLLAAISVGVVNGEIYCDLDYSEDSIADSDINLVINDEGKIVEIQGTAEQVAFSQEQLFKILEIGKKAIDSLIAKQKEVIDNLNKK